MKKKLFFCFLVIIILVLIIFTTICFCKKDTKSTKKLEATVMAIDSDSISVQDNNNIIYTFNNQTINTNIGDKIVIEYTGLLNKNYNIQDNKIIDYTIATIEKNENGIPKSWLDNGIFSQYYILANDKLQELTLEEKISQLLLVRYPDNDPIGELGKYQFGGYLFFEKDFKNKTKKEVQNMMASLQKSAKIPILTAVDEEGGKVVRISSNTNLVNEKFKSSQELYALGGFETIKNDTINKSNLLNSLGINLNLAPVVDVSTNPNDYMYERSFGQNTELTSTYAKTVINASKNLGVSYTLKHFPGYGNNDDTHNGISVDNRDYDDIINNDLPPFKAGIDVGAEAVLVSHNIVTNIDNSNPASLSPSIHNLLRNELNFTGIIITDDLAMGAISSINNATVKAILAGNDLIITTDYIKSINEIKAAVNDGTISEDLIDKLAFRVLAWKYYKGLMFINK
ncbi:MAG: glycoside hydrolase family 3 N-terminal domain-containing protein [Bacilli bacterium]